MRRSASSGAGTEAEYTLRAAADADMVEKSMADVTATGTDANGHADLGDEADRGHGQGEEVGTCDERLCAGHLLKEPAALPRRAFRGLRAGEGAGIVAVLRRCDADQTMRSSESRLSRVVAFPNGERPG